MDQKLLEELKGKLIEQKKRAEDQLKRFADKDKKLEGDWDSRFPNFTNNESGSGAMEQAADEVEEYGSRLPVEYELETELQNINLALGKIQKNKYGICENCHQEIEKERLRAHPSARYCLTCSKK